MDNKKLTWKHYLGIAVVAVLVIYLVIGFSFSNKFFWGTKINGMNVAGKTADQVIEMFDKKANDYSLTIKERKDKTEIVSDARARAKNEYQNKMDQTKEEIALMKENARKDIEAEKQKTIAGLQTEIAGIALMAASKVVEKEANDKGNEKLLDDFLKEAGV